MVITSNIQIEKVSVTINGDPTFVRSGFVGSPFMATEQMFSAVL
jgi:hypothetical protein